MSKLIERECRYCFNIYEERINIPKYARVCPECRKKGLKGKLPDDVKKRSLDKKIKTNLERYGCEYPAKSDIFKKKTKETNLKKYGGHPAKTKTHQQKIKETNLKKYGGHPQQNKEVKEKTKRTNLKKYGTEYTFQSGEIKEKIKRTNLEKYGVEYGLQNSLILEKIKKTNIERYGVECVFQAEEIKEKIKNTNLEKYGVEYSCVSEEVKEKIKQTNLKRYGGHPQQNKEVKEKTKRTNLKKYGVEYTGKAEVVKDKIKKNIIDRYGVDHYSKTNEFKEKYKNTLLNKMVPIIKNYLENNNMELIGNYSNAYESVEVKCLVCNKIFKSKWNYIQQGYKCPFCFPRNRSRPEREIVEWLENLNIKCITNERKILEGRELDIYIPSKQIAIEFNGLYWHSEEFGCDKKYHISKTEICNKQNIQLIHIFEDEWNNKKDIVKHRLQQLLGISKAKRIHARKCFIKEIDFKTKDKFLEKYHLQGLDRSKIRLGAFYNNELISVMTFSHGSISKGSKSKKDIWELNRFCSNYNYHIPGIASKLLKYFQRHYKWKEIFSYADRRWSQGNVYEKLGFELDHITKPNYWYTKGILRIHRFALRKDVDNPEQLPEKEIRTKQGYLKIWDCGNLKFNKINDKYIEPLTF